MTMTNPAPTPPPPGAGSSGKVRHGRLAQYWVKTLTCFHCDAAVVLKTADLIPGATVNTLKNGQTIPVTSYTWVCPDCNYSANQVLPGTGPVTPITPVTH